MRFLGCDIGVPLPATVRLPHPLGIVIESGSVIGRDVIIWHGATIAKALGREGAPRLEDNVWVGAGAKILGRVHIGRAAQVGADATVTEDVSAGSCVVASV